MFDHYINLDATLTFGHYQVPKVEPLEAVHSSFSLVAVLRLRQVGLAEVRSVEQPHPATVRQILKLDLQVCFLTHKSCLLIDRR